VSNFSSGISGSTNDTNGEEISSLIGDLDSAGVS
jgi:hypothetical protein